MPRLPESQGPRASPSPKPAAAAARKAHRVVRKLAQSSLLAAGIAVTYMGLPETDPRYHVFNPTLVDRLQAPITRHHE
jgi:hypothetical protein